MLPSLRSMRGQLCREFGAAVAQRRAQASRIVVMSLSSPPGCLLPEGGGNICKINAYTDPFHWQRVQSKGSPSAQGQQHFVLADGALGELPAMLLQNRHPSADGPDDAVTSSHTTCVIVDCLTTLLLHYPTHQVYSFLQQLKASSTTSCIITSVHQDVHEPHTLAGVYYLSTCLVQLQPVGQLQRDVVSCQLGKVPHGFIDFKFKRRTGRVRVESRLYTLSFAADGSGFLDMYAAPPQLLELTPGALLAPLAKDAAASPRHPPATALAAPAAAAAAATAKASAAGGAQPGRDAVKDLTQALAGGMHLGLSEVERQARERVVLPYEHQGQAKVYQSGNFKDYLPPAAGGHGAAAGGPGYNRLGHIMYVRDSEEEHDSDEDPDDDLYI